MKFDKKFLKRVLSIPSVSYREERVRDFILEFAKRRAITATVDVAGNVYLTKGKVGKGEYVPCFGNHMEDLRDVNLNGLELAFPRDLHERPDEVDNHPEH